MPFPLLYTMDTHPNIFADPKVMTGVPCIKGTRVTVANIVRQIGAGRSPEDLCLDYPYLTHEGIRDALEFAAELSAAETHELMPG